MQEPQASIITNSILKHSAKNAIPIEMSITILKDKEQKIVLPLKSDTVAHSPSSGWKRVFLRNFEDVKEAA